MRQAALAATMGSAPMHALIDRLPAVRGGYRADVPLAKYTWLRVGGAAEVLFEPADRDDLAATRALVENGQLSLSDLITHQSAAHDATSAYQTAFEDPACLKMILNWEAHA